MARTIPTNNPIQTLVDDFVTRLVATVEAQATQRVQQAVLVAIGAGPRKRGRPPKYPTIPSYVPLAPISARKPREKQLCPVPGCKNPAAPVFGMMCGEHKDLPKATIKKYREQRKAEKAKMKAKEKGKARSRSNGKAAPAAATAAEK